MQKSWRKIPCALLLVPIVFGVDWLDAVPVVAMLMLVGIRFSLSMIQAAVIRGLGKPHLEMAVAIAGVALSAVLILVAIPFRLVAATAAFLASGISRQWSRSRCWYLLERCSTGPC